MDDDIEVLIAGAGPVGLALALELQRFGIRFRIVEKKPERSALQSARASAAAFGSFAISASRRGCRARVWRYPTVNARSGEKSCSRSSSSLANQAGRDACQPHARYRKRHGGKFWRRRCRNAAGRRPGGNSSVRQDAAGVNAVGGVRRSARKNSRAISVSAKVRTASSANGGFLSPAPHAAPLSARDVTIDWDLRRTSPGLVSPGGRRRRAPFGAQKWRDVERAELRTKPRKK